jgi:hypothetical protein
MEQAQLKLAEKACWLALLLPNIQTLRPVP